MSSHGVHVVWCVCGAVSALAVCFAASSGWFVSEAPWLSPPAPTLVNSVVGVYFVDTSRFCVFAVGLAAIFVGGCGFALAVFLEIWCVCGIALFVFSSSRSLL